MKNLKVIIKLFLPHIVILLLLVVGIIISLVGLLNIEKQADALYNESYIVKNAADTVNSAFESMQKSIFHSIANNSEDSTNQEIANVKECKVIIQEQIAIVKQNFLGDLDAVSRLENNLSELAPMQEHVINLVDQIKNAEAAEYMENNNIPVIKEAQKELALFIQTVDTKENEIITSLQETQRNTIILLVSLGIISVLFSIWVGTYIRRLPKEKYEGRC